jgi:hypothetical protein
MRPGITHWTRPEDEDFLFRQKVEGLITDLFQIHSHSYRVQRRPGEEGKGAKESKVDDQKPSPPTPTNRKTLGWARMHYA